MDLITNWEGESNFNANLGQNELHNSNQNQLCYPCNKNQCFVFHQTETVLNSKAHNLGKTASWFLFW